MDMRHAHAVEAVRIVPDQKIDPIRLGQVRAEIKRHFETGGTIEELEIEPNSPVPGTAFAFVAPTPKLPSLANYDRSFWRRCCYCQTDRKYKDGKIVLCADGYLRLIGPDCWHHHIDKLDWNAAKEDWAAYQRRERFETLKDRLKPALETFRSELRFTSEKFAGSIAFTDTFSPRFASLMPELARHLGNAISRNSGELSVDRMVPAFGALEGAAGYRTSQEKDQAPRYRPQAETLHRLAGVDALSQPQGSTKKQLEEARKSVDSAIYKFRNTDWDSLSNIAFKKIADEIERDCKTSIGAVETLLKNMHSVRTFLSRPNITGITKWANDHDCELCFSGTYKIIPNGIRHAPERGDFVEIALPEGFAIPRLGTHQSINQLLTI